MKDINGNDIRTGKNELDPMFWRHLKAYDLVSSCVKSAEVLDIGCGDGYGAYHMSRFVKSVVGIDYDEPAIVNAREKYNAPNLSYELLDAEKVNSLGSKFDVITCFQNIEHIEHPENMVEGVKKILKPNGLFIVSVVNRLLRQGKSPYHYREYSPVELESFMSNYFSKQLLFGIYGKGIMQEFMTPREKDGI
jgi:2-polyprenyl-3-methyl-5-hydroxy-6-metoxy-1,4-benzoquinol methylase